MNVKLVHLLAIFMAALFLWPALFVPALAESGPDRPEDLIADISADGITLRWTAPAGPVDGYQILRRRPDVGEEVLMPLVENTGNSETCFHDIISKSGVYVYRVKAISGGVVGERSPFVRVEFTLESAPEPQQVVPAQESTADAATDSSDEHESEAQAESRPEQERDQGGNRPPQLQRPIPIGDLVVLFPRGDGTRLSFSGEPAHDPDGDDISYRFAFQVPALNNLQEPHGALLSVTRSGDGFLLAPRPGVSPHQFHAVYGQTDTVPVVLAGISASDGETESPPLGFNLYVVYDGSAQFSSPADYVSGQRWELAQTLEIYEGTAVLDATRMPTWTAVIAAERQWRLSWSEHLNDLTVRCEIAGDFTTYNWPNGGMDNNLFAVEPVTHGASGTVALWFQAPPDFEAPWDHNGDNLYQVRVMNTNNIHHLGGEGTPSGCSGSVIDMAIRVRDVGPPMAPNVVEAHFQESDSTALDVTWTAPTGFLDAGVPVAFPPGMVVTDYDYRYRMTGGDGWVEVTDTHLTETRTTLFGLTESAYEIQVRARSSEGIGSWSQSFHVENTNQTRAISWWVSGDTAVEGDPNGIEVVVRLDPPAGADSIVVPLLVSTQSNAAPGDYSGVPANLTFEPYSDHVYFRLTALPDSDPNEPEYEILCLEFGELPGNVVVTGPTEVEFRLQNTVTRPRIQRIEIVSSPANGNAYGYGEEIRVQLTFDGPVAVSGTPYLQLRFDEYVEQKAIYQVGSGSTVLEFVYWVFHGDRDRDGVSIPEGSVALNKGSIIGTAGGEQAHLGYPGLTDDPKHRVDGGTPPVVTLVELVPVPLREGEFLNAVVKMTPSIPPNFTTEVTGGVHIHDSAIDDVSLKAWRFYPGQTTTTSSGYVVFDDGRIARDRTIRVTVNSNFYSYTVGDPGTLSVQVMDDNDATLSSLTTSEGMLTPAFVRETTTYSAMVDNAVGNITVTAVPSRHDADINVNGQNGTVQTVPLEPGMNTVSIVVTAPGGAQLTYTLTVTRAMAGNPGTD